MVEEDQTADSEMNAAWQAVSYLVIEGPCDLTGAFTQSSHSTSAPGWANPPQLFQTKDDPAI
jgi:hypothetical protein